MPVLLRCFTLGSRAPSNYEILEYSSVCVLKATENNADQSLNGTVLFQQQSDGNLLVTLNVTGLSDGNHAFHVHEYGDVSSRDGMATGGHFIGDCDNCRPAGLPQEVGLLHNGMAMLSSGGEASVVFVEEIAKLGGVNSIDGRAIIIHGNSTSSSTRVAQCVIGRASGDVSAPGM